MPTAGWRGWRRPRAGKWWSGTIGTEVLPVRSMGRGTARSAVEGLPASGTAMRENQSHRRLDVPVKLARRNSQDPESMLVQPSAPILIPLGIVTHLVRDAVDLDDELGRGAVEIHGERAEGMLAAELDAVGAGAQHLPERSLRRRHLSP